MPGQRYYSFWNGMAAFIVLDTRSHRSLTGMAIVHICCYFVSYTDTFVQCSHGGWA